MYRIDNATSKATKDPYPAELSPAYFQDTNPSGGTIVPAWWCNQMQEEILGVLDAAALPPAKVDDNQLAEAINTLILAVQPATIAAAVSQTMQTLYPIGEYLTTLRAGNPSTWLGFGTWVRYAAGRTPVGYNLADTDFNTSGKEGGEKTHILTESELPSHNHNMDFGGSGGWDGFFFGHNPPRPQMSGGNGSRNALGDSSGCIKQAGGNAGHNNMPPYFTVFIWKRTA